MQRTRVDFPAPDSPMMPNTSPVSIVRLTSSSARTVPAAVSKDFDMFFSSIMWLSIAARLIRS